MRFPHSPAARGMWRERDSCSVVMFCKKKESGFTSQRYQGNNRRNTEWVKKEAIMAGYLHLRSHPLWEQKIQWKSMKSPKCEWFTWKLPLTRRNQKLCFRTRRGKLILYHPVLFSIKLEVTKENISLQDLLASKMPVK